jgi:hypothetical protein
MTRRCRLHIIGFMALLASLLATCSSNADTTPLDVPVHLLRNGDLALRCGTSLESHVVVGVNGENGPYSHIGIVVQIDGLWYIAHAVPGENERGEPEYVKLDPIQVYYGRDRAKLGCIMRVTDDSTVCRQATDYAQWAVGAKKVFDNNYDWEDSTELYCTEMVQRAYRHAGIDLAEDRHTRVVAALMPGTYVFPCDIVANRSLRQIATF